MTSMAKREPKDAVDGLRFDIFEILVNSKKPMSISQIARKLKLPRQNVAYHMPFLVSSGLVIQDGTEYFCQPLFIDDSLIESVAAHVSRIMAELLESGIYCDALDTTGAECTDPLDKKTVAENCLKALVSMVVTELTEDER